MKISEKELTQVVYSAAAIRVLNFKMKPASLCFRTHWHDRIEIIRVKKGEMQIEIANDTFLIQEGELAILPPKTIHKGYSLGTQLEYDVLMFDIRSFYNETDVCKKYLTAIFDGRAKFNNITDNREVIEQFDSICYIDDKDSLSATAEVYRFIDLLIKNCLLELSLKTDNTVTFEMINFLEENFTADVSSDAVARYFGYTVSHFCRKFKSATGLTPMKYLNIYRLEKARKLLQQGAGNVSKIAADCGFSDANYFTRSFKSHFGVAPKYYNSEN